MKSSRVCDLLDIKYPILQGGMAWIADASLAAAVSEAGGLGIITGTAPIEWIREEIEAFTDGTAEQLSERICEGAKRRRTDGHEDDITVMTAIIKKAV